MEWVTPEISELCLENNEGKEYPFVAETTTPRVTAAPS